MIDDFLAESAGNLTRVGDAVRAAAADEIMPRYRRLAKHEIIEKSAADPDGAAHRGLNPSGHCGTLPTSGQGSDVRGSEYPWWSG